MLKMQVKKLPSSPGVYFFKKNKEILYIGKAGSIKTRVLSYFSSQQDKDKKIILGSDKIDFIKTDSVLEAVLLESRLIKKYKPKYNILSKDDKSWNEILITQEDWPRVLLVRESDKLKGQRFGPIMHGKEVMKLLRRIFLFRDRCEPNSKPCFNFQIGLCPGVCSGAISQAGYKKQISHLKLFLKGQKKKVVKDIKKEMELASKDQDFETAIILRNKLFKLQNIHDISLIRESKPKSFFFRIEAYDISNISGKYGTGSMVVFENGEIAKDYYRKFKIRTVKQANDIAMIREVFKRRLKHKEWVYPDLVVIDGGIAQFNVAKEFFSCPIVAIAKKPDRLLKSENIKINKKIIQQIRDEAHRFAVQYHRKLRESL